MRCIGRREAETRAIFFANRKLIEAESTAKGFSPTSSEPEADLFEAAALVVSHSAFFALDR